MAGRKEEAAALRTFTEEVLLTGAWGSFDFSHFRIGAGIAAACAGDWWHCWHCLALEPPTLSR